MKAENASLIPVISPHAIIRPCSMVTATCLTIRKEYLQ